MTKARDLANAGTALTSVSATELGYVDGVTSAIQTQIDSKEPTLPSQTGNSGKYLTTDGTNKSWGTVSQYSLPSQTGNSGKFLTTNGTSESWGTVTQPFDWNWKFRTASSQQIQCFESNGSNIYVVGCDGGQLFSSTDSGATWTSRTSGFGTSRIHAIAFGNGIFVAVGADGKITTSTDGITWTARTSNMSTNIINSVEYLNGTFVAVGQGSGTGGTGGITTSTDGITWTKRTTPAGATTLYHVAYGNGYYVACGSLNTTAGYYSTNLSTWTALPTTVNTATHYVTFKNDQFILLIQGANNAFYTGNNPSTGWTYMSGGGIGTVSAVGSADDLKNKVQFYNNRYYYIPSNSTAPFLCTSFGGAITGNPPGLGRPGPSYNLPILASSNSAYQSLGALYITSTGRVLVADGSGNCFTSF